MAQTLPLLTDRALEAEPSIQSASAGVEAAKARNRQASGALLPQITANMDTKANMRGYQTRAPNLLQEKDRFNSHDWQITLSQPLWRYANLADKQQAIAQLGQAGFQLKAARQQLLAKLVEAWLELLAARDSHDVAVSQAAAAEQQLAIIVRGSQLGIHGLPQQEEAAAKFMQAQSEVLATAADIEVKRAAVEQLTGPIRKLRLQHLIAQPALPELMPVELHAWLKYVEEANPEIQSSRMALDAAREDIGKQLANYMPSVDLVGNYSKNSQGVGGFPGQNGYDIQLGYVGIQVNWTLFSSGIQGAKVDEARAMLLKAESALENSRRTALNQAKQAWFSFQVALSRIRAGQKGVESGRWALKAADAGRNNGLKGELDVLQARQQWLAARRDLAKGYYDAHASRFRLMALADMITREEIQALDDVLQEDAMPVPAFVSEMPDPISGVQP